MITSVHLARPGVRRAIGSLRKVPRPGEVQGLTYAETVLPAPLGPGLLPRPALSELGLIAAWKDDQHLDGFLADPALSGPFASGWHVRMHALRVAGAWPEMPGLPTDPIDPDGDGPVAVLTLGRPRVRRLPAFLVTSARAEGDLEGASGLLASTGLAHPPRLLSTFSLWENSRAMRAYAHRQAGGHVRALATNKGDPFHHESAFIRLRPYESTGDWDGRDPLGGLLDGR